MKTQYETFKTILLDLLEQRLQYEESETDAYADYFDEKESRLRFARKIKERDSRFKDVSEMWIVDQLQCTCFYEVVPGSIFGPFDYSNDCVLSSAAIQETEEQFCFDDPYIEDVLKTPIQLIKPFFRLAKKEREICATINDREALCYQATDAVWFAVITNEALDELHDAWTEKQKEREQ